MTNEILSQIKRAEDKMKDLDPSSRKYMHYFGIKIDLQKKLRNSPVKLHVADEGICESCQ